MCGILGYVGNDRTVIDRFPSALDTLVHRGPDDSGIFRADGVILGHRRLSIIDLSKEGHQPFVDASSGNVVTYNGEIYNYLEIRESLETLGHDFRSACDTEVLLHAYREWGEACLQKFNGMFSFSILDPEKKRLFFARDRFGVKPFYYTRVSGFIFASEPKAILKLDPSLAKPDLRALYEFLQFGRLGGSERTFLENIESLLPAHYGVLDLSSGRIETCRYWDYPEQSSGETDPRSIEAEFERCFDDAVALRTRSDVPVGLTLSGGIDSTGILASLSKTGVEDLSSFTSVYGGSGPGELDWARLACAPYSDRVTLTEVLAGAEGWLSTLEKIVWHMDGPGLSPAVYPVWRVMERARQQGVPVLLEGQGADELLGGYVNYSALDLLESMKNLLRPGRRASLREVVNKWQAMGDAFGVKPSVLWVLRESFPFLFEMNRKRNTAAYALKDSVVESCVVSGARNDIAASKYPDDPVSERLCSDHAKDILPSLLHYGDAISMAHSIECRQPFLDYRLVEFVFRLRSEQKIKGGRTKAPLRGYLMRAGQEAIARRADKVGYMTPVDAWMSKDNCTVLRLFLLEGAPRILEFCERGRISELIERFGGGGFALGNHMYRLLTTEIWLRSLADHGRS
ncbi:MAG: asparagine synthase (glutamine-hydrolyzing) [Pseudomonadales bacterium]|jgi:asparagine synthase (glutamine-hydrolysing)|nr:asparagine synthase (glutamine-hydrolyzing) [Pseudomonadales bacterium]